MILSDEERIVQLPVIIYCLTCKYMLRLKDTAALCYNAVKFNRWKLQEMLLSSWDIDSKGSSTYLVFQADNHLVIKDHADRPSKYALQDLRAQDFYVYLKQSMCFRVCSIKSQTCEYLRRHKLQYAPRAPSLAEMTAVRWQPKVQSS